MTYMRTGMGWELDTEEIDDCRAQIAVARERLAASAKKKAAKQELKAHAEVRAASTELATPRNGSHDARDLARVKKAKKTKGVKRKGPADAVLLKAEKVARQSGLKGGVLAATIARRAKERERLAPKTS